MWKNIEQKNNGKIINETMINPYIIESKKILGDKESGQIGILVEFLTKAKPESINIL